MERGGVALSEDGKVFAEIVLQRCGRRGGKIISSETSLPLGQK